jgi:glutathione peroxidase-family protein
MKFLILIAILLIPAWLGAATVGESAPAFSLIDSHGQTHSLSDFRGKTVVLEWTNAECPFVKKHYDSGNMQKQQAGAVADGVIWLTINSGAPGKQGHVSSEQANAIQKNWKAASTAYLIDADGKVGRAYDAKTTPHMYVIDADGVLRYNGAIDSIASADKGDLAKAVQFVPSALAAVADGEAPDPALTRPYGCSVKY